MHITLPDGGDYATETDRCVAAGMDVVLLTFSWNAFEKDGARDLSNATIANAFSPAKNLSLLLTVTPIYAVHNDAPVDLRALPLDHPAVMARFAAFLDSLHRLMPSVRLTGLIIGNEVDLYNGTDAARWAQYNTFLDSARAAAYRLWGPSLPVSAELTFSSTQTVATAAFAKSLSTHTYFAAVSYYPLEPDFKMQPPNAAEEDVEAMIRFADGKSLFIEETGYAPSATCGSSEEDQARFD